jgi:hypothetical protein
MPPQNGNDPGLIYTHQPLFNEAADCLAEAVANASLQVLTALEDAAAPKLLCLRNGGDECPKFGIGEARNLVIFVRVGFPFDP